MVARTIPAGRTQRLAAPPGRPAAPAGNSHTVLLLSMISIPNLSGIPGLLGEGAG